jgi:PKD repeat protein
VAPVLSLDPVTGPTTMPGVTTVSGSVEHAGSLDTETVSIDWGDGSSADHATKTPGLLPLCPCNPELSSISATKLGFTGTHTYSTAGSHTVTVTASDHGGGTDTETLTVDVIGTQVLDFPAIADHTYGDPAFDVSVTGGGSGQPVELTSTTPAVCTVSDPADPGATGSITLRAAGTCTLEADQEGNADYPPADPVLRSFTVAKAALTITAQDKTITLHDAVPRLPVAYHGLVDGDTAAVVHGLVCAAQDGSGRTVTATSPVGSYAITCSGAAADDYAISYQPGVLRVVFDFDGFLSVKSGRSVNTVKAGAAVPVIWLITDGRGLPVVDRGSFSSITATPMACGGAVPTDGGTPIGPASGLRRFLVIFWQYTWKTKKALKGTCQAMTLHLSDGTSHTALFRFR